MKTLSHLLFVAAFASCISMLNPPLFDDRKHETFEKSVTKWGKITRSIKANGLQKFTLGRVEVWAIDIEKGIVKICRRLKIASPQIKKVGDEFHLLLKHTV